MLTYHKHSTMRLLATACLLGLLSVAVGSCGVKNAQKTVIPPTTPVSVVENPSTTPTAPPPTKQDNLEPTTTPSDVAVTPPRKPSNEVELPPKQPNTTKPTNNDISRQKDIALFLPFIASQYREGMNPDSLSDKSKMALEFYQGFLCGLDNLRLQGINLNVQVFDTENNANKVSRILADSTAMRDIDLIIGPINNSELKETAAYAKRRQIYNVSPLSPATQNTNDNPYYLIVNPPIETHGAAIYDYVSRGYANKRIITVAGSKPNEQNLAALFSHWASKGSVEGGGSMPIQQLTYRTSMTTTAEIEAQMGAGEQNVFVIANFADEAFIVDLINKLNALRNRYPISVFGMPNWVDLPNLPLDMLANLDFHYTTPFFDTQSAESERFRQSFYAKYRSYPTEYAAKAYDLINYFGTMQHQYGKQAGAKLQDKNGLFTNFKFRAIPTLSNKMATDYIENRYINIIHFRNDYVLEKAN